MWGRIENGQKTGNWQYFDEPGELSLMVNYTTGKLSYIKPDTSKYLVNDGHVWLEATVQTPPRFIGSKKEVIDFLYQNITFPLDARVHGVEGITIISAVIDETGDFGNFEIVKNLEGGYTEEVIGELSELPNTWIQATSSSGAIASKFYFVVSFGIGGHYKITQKDSKEFSAYFESKPYIINLNFAALGTGKPR